MRQIFSAFRSVKNFLSVAVLVLALLFATSIQAHAASLKLTWQDTSNNEDEFRIERSLTGTTLSFARIATPPANATTHTDTGLPENTSYTYRIQACNAAGCSAFSATAEGKTPLSMPAAPGSLTVTPLP